MTDRSVILIGGPDSGKTNYLARLWEALRSGKGRLAAPAAPSEITYVEEALEHLLRGQFAPRSDKNVSDRRKTFTISVVSEVVGETGLVVPDVTGELWKGAVETNELPPQWMTTLREAAGAIVFVRVGSDQNVAPLDWVTTAQLLRMPLMTDEESEGEAPADRRPTQVALCELLRFLEYSLAADTSQDRPRVAILITAWDRVDKETAAAGPTEYLRNEYPLFFGRLEDDLAVEVKVFGVSIVSGDFIDPDFRNAFFENELSESGYVVVEGGSKIELVKDITVPVAWTLGDTGN